MNHPEWLDQGPEPVLPAARSFAYGERVAVHVLGPVAEVLQGEIRAVDGPLAVVLIDGRLERVPLDLISPLT